MTTKNAGASPVERHVRPRLTPWFPHATKPVRPGFYRWQDWTMGCNCCWCVAHWNGREWHTDLFERGRFNTLLFDSQVKRWRGLAQRPNV
jgi:hypothetical protein